MSDDKIKIYIKIQYGSVVEVRSDRPSDKFKIEIADLDSIEDELNAVTLDRWNLETNQLYQVYKYE